MIAVLLAFSDEKDRSKYEQLYVRYRHALYRITKSIVKEEHLAQDALQECFIKVFLNMKRIDEIESEKTRAFLVAIAKNAAIDIYRREKKIKDVTDPEETSLYYVESDFDIEEVFANTELSKALVEYISQLSETERNVILLKYFYSYSDREIAELMDITSGNVRIKLMRAKQKLAKLIIEGKEDDSRDCI